MVDPMRVLGGSIVALVTPFRDGTIDRHALAALCERQILAGTTALVVCGSTGEAATLSPGEQAEIIDVAVECASGRAPVIVGCTASATAHAVSLAMDAARHGADGLLCAPPPYNKPTQDGIFAHIRAIAHAADLPIVLYDVPGRVGVAISDATVGRLTEAGLIVALKDATADLSRLTRLRALCGEGLRLLTGDDAMTAAFRAMGGHGCVSVTANVAPSLCMRLHAAWDAGELAGMAGLRDQLDPLHAAMFVESNPIPVKAALAMAALCEDEMRLPLTRATAATRETLAGLLSPILDAEEMSVAGSLLARFSASRAGPVGALA